MCKSIVNFSTSLIIGLYDTFNNGNVIIIQLNYLLVSLILFIWILSYSCILIFSISKNIFQTILPALMFILEYMLYRILPNTRASPNRRSPKFLDHVPEVSSSKIYMTMRFNDRLNAVLTICLLHSMK